MIYINADGISYKFDLSSKKKKYQKLLDNEEFVKKISNIKVEYLNNVNNVNIPPKATNIKVGRLARISAKLGQPASVPKVVGESVSYETATEKIKVDVYSNTHNIKTEKKQNAINTFNIL